MIRSGVYRHKERRMKSSWVIVVIGPYAEVVFYGNNSERTSDRYTFTHARYDLLTNTVVCAIASVLGSAAKIERRRLYLRNVGNPTEMSSITRSIDGFALHSSDMS